MPTSKKPKPLFTLPPDPWPRLSRTLRGPVAPDYCQSCRLHRDALHPDGTEVLLTRWIECDQRPGDPYDKEDPTVVVLCKPCGQRLIEPHPRLYLDVPENAPLPGTMDLCLGCRYRDRLRCTHPDRKANGGSGLMITCSKPQTYFLDGRRGGKRAGWTHTRYAYPPSACAGRDHQPVADRAPLLTADGQVVEGYPLLQLVEETEAQP